MKKFTLRDGKKIDNPLYSYTLQTGIFDNLTTIPDADYTKLKGYETVRYPLSGLVGGSDEQREETAKYNAQWPTPEDRKAPLNDNVVNWLDRVIPLSNEYIHHGTYEKFRKCLEAPNYTLFSNTSSAYQYNQENLNREKPNFADKDILVVPLESPHNDMHLAVGGYSVPPATPDPSAPRANGDMVRLVSSFSISRWLIKLFRGRMIPPHLTQSFSSITATSIECSGSGSSDTTKPRDC